MREVLRAAWRFLRYGDERRLERDFCRIFAGHEPHDWARDVCLGCNSTYTLIYHDAA